MTGWEDPFTYEPAPTGLQLLPAVVFLACLSAAALTLTLLI